MWKTPLFKIVKAMETEEVSLVLRIILLKVFLLGLAVLVLGGYPLFPLRL